MTFCQFAQPHGIILCSNFIVVHKHPLEYITFSGTLVMLTSKCTVRTNHLYYFGLLVNYLQLPELYAIEVYVVRVFTVACHVWYSLHQTVHFQSTH